MFRTIMFLALCYSPSIFAQSYKIVHCIDGECPKGTRTDTVSVREIFVLGNNAETKFADWVAYRVTRATIETSAGLDRDWQVDDLLETDDTLEADDYSGANRAIKIDRGHQAPLASFAGTIYWRTTNILSNITPQKSALNRGPWLDLEAAVRNAVYDLGELYVVTGPLYLQGEAEDSLPNADESHQLPTGYFKIVSTEGGRMSVFIFDQDDTRDSKPYCTAISTLETADDLSGYQLLPSIGSQGASNLNLLLGCS